MNPRDHNGSSFEDRAQHFGHDSASVDFDYDAIDRALGVAPSAIQTSIAVFAATLRVMIMDIERAGKNAAREAAYHRLALGVRTENDESMRTLALAWGISPEAVSKRVKQIRDKHQIPLNAFNKTAQQAEKYRNTNLRRK